MRKLLIVLALLPLGTALWPSSARALACDPAVSGSACSAGSQILHMARADAVLPAAQSADRAVQIRQSRSQSGAGAASNGGVKAPATASPMNPAPQPGGGALLIAGLLGMVAVARRRIPSILG